MRREELLRRRLESLGTLQEAVTAMKSLSAHHFRTARAALAAARAYQTGIDALLAAADIVQEPPPTDEPAMLLIGADLGLCDGYNARLTEHALSEWRRLGTPRVYCVGRRPLTAFRRATVTVARSYPAVTSVTGLTRLLLSLADDVVRDYLNGAFSSLSVVAARFDGVGAFSPMTTRVLPIVPTARARHPATTPYGTVRHLAHVAVREYLYSMLFQLLLDALAAEHGARLVATQAAGQWLEEQIGQLHRQIMSIRRESSTQDVLDVAAGARQRRLRRSLSY